MKIGFFLFFLVGSCATALVCAQGAPSDTAQQEVDINMVKMILDGIESNRSQIEPFEAVFTRISVNTIEVGGKLQERNQTATIHYWAEKNREKWRCDTEKISFYHQKGERGEIPYKSSSVYNGKETRYIREDHAVGEVDANSTMKENSDIIDAASRFSNVDIRERIQKANLIEIITADGESQIKITVTNPSYNFTRIFWLNPKKGYNLERAEFWVGDKLAELQIAETISKFGKAWIVTDLRNKQYSETGKVLHQQSLHTDFVNYGKPISAKVFNLDFSPGTYVEDNVAGKTYQVPYLLENTPEELRNAYTRWFVIALVDIIVLAYLVRKWFLHTRIPAP